jgi:hypothetical protein
LKPYWNSIKEVVTTMLQSPTKQEMWKVAVCFSDIADKICRNCNARLRFSDLVGFGPFPLKEDEAKRPATDIYEASLEPQGTNQFLIKVFLRSSHILTHALLVRVEGEIEKDKLIPSDVTALDFAKAILHADEYYTGP